ncbi:hypothetical protein CEUSTIGMA_g3484.t1 [Chlamydomonas eustigma]|uniref:Major facilitator superfamily (MFS) profile domain-containing protein n=1 Tax=Chlamydomonas eustigma TaxID=1157962 RepID=A0A250WYY4_9CHLO|nr:hypothetical protein CEUSTIGMA_g3484.t1 [Chlamydomonas eustigma]|eukprot:GAX76041.1 hypothetical protein CEUSTIGMA_g3484.t1 [Chlamydomonas eustigma]
MRMFAFGIVGMVLALYLSEVGLSDSQIGILLNVTLLGDAAISLLVTLNADRLGHRHMLLLGCALQLLGAVVFAYNDQPCFWLLTLGATIGVISPSGNEVGPFMALEQPMLSDLVDPSSRTYTFAWYNVLGYFSTALGSLLAGASSTWILHSYDITIIDVYRLTFVEYGGLSIVMALLVFLLSSSVEFVQQHKAGGVGASVFSSLENGEQQEPLLLSVSEEVDGDHATSSMNSADPGAESKRSPPVTSLQQPADKESQASFYQMSEASRWKVFRLSVLFAADSFAGSMVAGSLLAYYFQVIYKVDDTYLGGILFGANIIAGFSSFASGWVANRFGLINTMVFTHLPSNIIVILLPLMPTLQWATAMTFLRFSISQMDVVPRQSYISGIVPAEERTAAMGIVNVMKSLGAAFGPLVTGWLAQTGHFGWAFYLCGGIKIMYDVALLWSFGHLKAEHER